MDKVDEIQKKLGGKLISDPYPYYRYDREKWLMLLSEASKNSIGLYGILMYLRAIGATLERNAKFGYIIKPIIRGEEKWGWPTKSMWEEERKRLLPYREKLLTLLKKLD